MGRASLAHSALVILVGALLLPGCRRPERPQFDAWEPVWQQAVSEMANVADLGATDDPRQRCNETLVALREIEVALLRTPHPLLDEAVRDWFHSAESSVFECALAHGDSEAFATRVRETSILADEVDVALADLQD